MSGAVKATLNAALLEFQARSQDALSLFRAMPTQVGFINSNASHRLVRGGNRSGKSTICAVEIASAAMGRPVIGPDGKALKFKYPQDRPLMIWVIGLGQSHIGDTLHRLLFKPGAFKVIKDLSTGVMRAWNPDDPADLAREAEKQDAPSLIPERYATEDTFAWDNKKAKVFTHWTNPSNGTVIRAFTSLGDVKQGDPVDLIWIDEDIQNPDDINEFTTRLSDRKGRLIWSSWPRIANPALLRMSTRATEQQGREKPDCQEWCLKFTGNPHIDADEKRKRLDEWGPEVARARDQGEFVLDTVLVYPEFNEELHCTPPRAGHEWSEVDKILAANNYVPPRDWTRRLFLDPGHSTTAMLFTATTPPSLGSYVVFYDGLYIHNCTAEEAAKRAYEKIAGYKFYSFTIDYRFGRQHHPGNALPGGDPRSNREIYAAAFQKYGLQSQVTGSSFNWSSDDVTAGLTAFRSWLIPQSNGRPKVRIVKHKLIEFIKEIQLYRKQVTKDVSEDKPANGQHDHFMDTARYAAMERCDFVAVIDDGLGGRDPGDSYRDFHQNFNRGRQQSSSVTCTFGPGVAA
jgi:hypothetical protein